MNGGAVTLVYDGDGNRVSKTVGGVTTKYLVDDLNPTGYAQVVEELVGGAVTRQYTYGLQRVSQQQFISNTWTPSFYGYDGGGNVRNLTNTAGAITDEYLYDAFGNSFTKAGNTPNNYLYRGEQYDGDLGLYYLRARYYNPATGRFLSRDPEDDKLYDQAAFHKYLYASGNPVNRIDPRGRPDLVETGFALEKATIRTDLIAGAIGCGASLGFTVAEAMLAQDYSFGFLNPDGSISGAGTAGNAAAIAGCLTTMFSRIPAASKLGVLAGWVGCIASVVQVIQDIQQIEKDTDPAAVENDGKKAETDLISGDFGCALTIAGAVGAF
jgi:RHS repeat-associated protein